MENIKVLIADDHPIFLSGLKQVLQKEKGITVVEEAAAGRQALDYLLANDTDIAVLDIDMPGLNGLEVAEAILEKKPAVSVILLTMHKGRDAFIKALEIGISGYVLKENAVVDVVQAIRNVSAGNNYISPEMSEFLAHQQKTKPLQDLPGDVSMLTPSEFRILQMIASYRSTKDIADTLFISEKTVANHRMNMVRKLKLSGKNSLLRFAMENL